MFESFRSFFSGPPEAKRQFKPKEMKAMKERAGGTASRVDKIMEKLKDDPALREKLEGGQGLEPDEQAESHLRGEIVKMLKEKKTITEIVNEIRPLTAEIVQARERSGRRSPEEDLPVVVGREIKAEVVAFKTAEEYLDEAYAAASDETKTAMAAAADRLGKHVDDLKASMIVDLKRYVQVKTESATKYKQSADQVEADIRDHVNDLMERFAATQQKRKRASEIRGRRVA
jgi:hypothetical protein